MTGVQTCALPIYPNGWWRDTAQKLIILKADKSVIPALEEMAPVKVVGTAVDQAGALTWLTDASNRCDIAIIDIFLRQGSGMGVLRALSTAPFERVVLTNYATADIRRQCLALGASAVFDKSGEIDALVAHCVARAASEGDAHPAELR